MQSIIILDNDTAEVYNVIRTIASTEKVEKIMQKYRQKHAGEWTVEGMLEDLREHVSLDDTEFSIIRV